MSEVFFEGFGVDEFFKPATSGDIIEGNVVYLFDGNSLFKLIVKEVYNPNDDFKAFSADNGCRHGLYNLYVLKSYNDLVSRITKLENIIARINDLTSVDDN